MNDALYLLLSALAIIAAIPISLWVIGTIFHKRCTGAVETAKTIAPLLTPLLTVATLCVAGFVAYTSWLSPFRPLIQARPHVWRMGQSDLTGCPFSLVTFLTLFNDAATSGAISDLLVTIWLPHGKWTLEPLFFIKPEFYSKFVKSPAAALTPEIIEGPYTPIFLAPRAQATKSVLICPGFGKDDFKAELFATGQHRLDLLARYDEEPFMSLISKQQIIVEQAHLDELKAGNSKGNEVRHRDVPVKTLPRRDEN